MLVGFQESALFQEETIQLLSGDRVLLYTDGIVDTTNRRGEVFGVERLCDFVQALPRGLAAKECVERTLAHVRVFSDGEEYADDITLMVVRVR